jgi:hypothetical protein
MKGRSKYKLSVGRLFDSADIYENKKSDGEERPGLRYHTSASAPELTPRWNGLLSTIEEGVEMDFNDEAADTKYAAASKVSCLNKFTELFCGICQLLETLRCLHPTNGSNITLNIGQTAPQGWQSLLPLQPKEWTVYRIL